MPTTGTNSFLSELRVYCEILDNNCASSSYAGLDETLSVAQNAAALSSRDETACCGRQFTDLFDQTVQVLVILAMSPDTETLDDIALNREVDPLIDAYLVWVRTRRPAGFRPKDYNERDELARAFWDKVPPTQISERIRARVARGNDV